MQNKILNTIKNAVKDLGFVQILLQNPQVANNSIYPTCFIYANSTTSISNKIPYRQIEQPFNIFIMAKKNNDEDNSIDELVFKVINSIDNNTDLKQYKTNIQLNQIRSYSQTNSNQLNSSIELREITYIIRYEYRFDPN